jgi:hypothetical protein
MKYYIFKLFINDFDNYEVSFKALQEMTENFGKESSLEQIGFTSELSLIKYMLYELNNEANINFMYYIFETFNFTQIRNGN